MVRPIPYKGNEPYIFISYAHRDSQQVWPIITLLQQAGLKVWYDEGIDPGTEWDEFIATHIEQCGYFIAFLSQAYLDSDNCKDELNFVRDLGKERLLVYLENVTLPSGMRMRLGRLQAIHWYNYPDINMAFAKLMETPELSQYSAPVDTLPQEKTQNIADLKAPPSMPQPKQPLSPEEHYRKGVELFRQKDYAKAIVHLSKAAGEGHHYAQFYMGICFEYGWGVEENHRSAVMCYQKAAAGGVSEAQFNLGLCLYHGKGIPQDHQKAVVCYRQAAKQGDPEAQNALAVCYSNGHGVERDEEQAIFWFTKAAEQNNPRALYNLGRRYAMGQGVVKNEATAVSLLRRAADMGHSEARRLLVQVYHLKEYE